MRLPCIHGYHDSYIQYLFGIKGDFDYATLKPHEHSLLLVVDSTACSKSPVQDRRTEHTGTTVMTA